MAANCIFLTYGAFLLVGVFYGIAIEEELFDAVFLDSKNVQVNATSAIVFRYLLYQHPANACLLLLCTVMGKKIH